jgi:hypothetical protein
MESKVNPILQLTSGGRRVNGAGPITNWRPGEVSTVFTFIIVQSQLAAPGANPPVVLAIATGASKRFRPADAQWTARGRVAAGERPLLPGPAVAYARAWIEYTGGWLEPYDWDVHIVLQ